MSTTLSQQTKKVSVAQWSKLPDRQPQYALVAHVDLVVVRYDDDVSVLYGRCRHRGALMADGFIDGHNIICGVHNWDYRYDTGVSEYNNTELLHKFNAWVDVAADAVFVDENEILAWRIDNPQPYNREAYLGLYADVHGTPDEPHNKYIRNLAKNGLKKWGHHGQVSAMGVSMTELPRWEDLNIVTAQVARRPLLDDALVGTELVIGPNAKKPLRLGHPPVCERHEFWRVERRSQNGAGHGRGTGRHRHLFRRRGNAAGRASGQQSLLLRTGVRALWLEPGQGKAGAGVPL